LSTGLYRQGDYGIETDKEEKRTKRQTKRRKGQRDRKSEI
jgi:hypothetical protein